MGMWPARWLRALLPIMVGCISTIAIHGGKHRARLVAAYGAWGAGRAGGGEMGGVRGVIRIQRTAVQGCPDILAAIAPRWVPQSATSEGPAHPFRRSFHDLQIGETLHTPERLITIEDIEQFAHFTGDTFYAHMDEAAACATVLPGPRGPWLSDPELCRRVVCRPGGRPVLANTGLDNLRFLKPVQPGAATRARRSQDAQRTPMVRCAGRSPGWRGGCRRGI